MRLLVLYFLSSVRVFIIPYSTILESCRLADFHFSDSSQASIASDDASVAFPHALDSAILLPSRPEHATISRRCLYPLLSTVRALIAAGVDFIIRIFVILQVLHQPVPIRPLLKHAST